MASPPIKLLTSDGVVVTVNMDVIQMFGSINKMLADLGGAENVDPEPVKITSISSEILNLVIKWATYHKDDPPICREEDNDDDDDDKTIWIAAISPWDQEFLNHETVFGLMLAANYLDIKGLRDVCAKWVANTLKGKSPEEIRAMYAIHNDFTPEEEAAIAIENEWARDQTPCNSPKR